jgi:hypothetical protein
MCLEYAGFRRAARVTRKVQQQMLSSRLQSNTFKILKSISEENGFYVLVVKLLLLMDVCSRRASLCGRESGCLDPERHVV